MGNKGASELFEGKYGIQFTDNERFQFNEFMDTLTDLRGDNYTVRKFNNPASFANAIKTTLEVTCNKVSGTSFYIAIPIFTLRPIAEYAELKVKFANHTYRDIDRVFATNEEVGSNNLIIFTVIKGKQQDGVPVYTKHYEALVYNEKLDLATDKIMFTY